MDIASRSLRGRHVAPVADTASSASGSLRRSGERSGRRRADDHCPPGQQFLAGPLGTKRGPAGY